MQSGTGHPATTGSRGPISLPLSFTAQADTCKFENCATHSYAPLLPNKENRKSHLFYSDTPYPPRRLESMQTGSAAVSCQINGGTCAA
jgi:hypothetical protein